MKKATGKTIRLSMAILLFLAIISCEKEEYRNLKTEPSDKQIIEKAQKEYPLLFGEIKDFEVFFSKPQWEEYKVSEDSAFNSISVPFPPLGDSIYACLTIATKKQTRSVSYFLRLYDAKNIDKHIRQGKERHLAYAREQVIYRGNISHHSFYPTGIIDNTSIEAVTRAFSGSPESQGQEDPCNYGGSGCWLPEVIITAPAPPRKFPWEVPPRGPEVPTFPPHHDMYTIPPSSHGGGAGPGTSPTPEDTEEIIIDPLFKNTKAECVYEKLISLSGGFKKAIQKFDGEFPVSHLKFSINNNLGTYTYGVTIPPKNYVTEIQMNENSLGLLSDLGKATAMVHEVIHAEIFRKMLSAAQKGDLNIGKYTTQERINYVNSLKDNFPGLYDFYIERYRPTWNHNMMASHYRTTIADLLQNFDNQRLDRSIYEAVAWMGLRNIENNETSIAWDNLPDSEKQKVLNLINQHIFNGPSTCN